MLIRYGVAGQGAERGVELEKWHIINQENKTKMVETINDFARVYPYSTHTHTHESAECTDIELVDSYSNAARMTSEAQKTHTTTWAARMIHKPPKILCSVLEMALEIFIIRIYTYSSAVLSLLL